MITIFSTSKANLASILNNIQGLTEVKSKNEQNSNRFRKSRALKSIWHYTINCSKAAVSANALIGRLSFIAPAIECTFYRFNGLKIGEHEKSLPAKLVRGFSFSPNIMRGLLRR